MIVCRPVNSNEPDLLIGHERDQLRFVAVADAERVLLRVDPPLAGWTHDALEAAEWPQADAWNAFLGAQWIGSSEV